MVVPKYKRTGVERNRLKRRLREIARTRLLPALGARSVPPVDLVIRALPDAYGASFDRLRDEAVQAAERVVRRVGPAVQPAAGQPGTGGEGGS